MRFTELYEPSADLTCEATTTAAGGGRLVAEGNTKEGLQLLSLSRQVTVRKLQLLLTPAYKAAAGGAQLLQHLPQYPPRPPRPLSAPTGNSSRGQGA